MATKIETLANFGHFLTSNVIIIETMIVITLINVNCISDNSRPSIIPMNDINMIPAVIANMSGNTCSLNMYC